MKLMTQLLDIESIQPSKNGNYDVSKSTIEIEALAHAIVEAQVLLSIPIVKQIDLENYELISGDLEFHAYLKALEFDNNLPGRIGVYIINAKEEDVARKQVELTRQVVSEVRNEPYVDKSILLGLENALKRLENSQEILGQSINRIDKTMVTQEFMNQVIDRLLKALNTGAISQSPILPISDSLDMFHALENILDPLMEVQVSRNLTIFLGRGTTLKNTINLFKEAKKKGESLQSFDAVLKVIAGKGYISENRLRMIRENWK
jgi:hypothetical protein